MESSNLVTVPMDITDNNDKVEVCESKQDAHSYTENIPSECKNIQNNFTKFHQENTQINVKTENAVPHVIKHFTDEKENLIREAESVISLEKNKLHEASVINSNLNQSFENLKCEYISEHAKNEKMIEYIKNLEKIVNEKSAENVNLRRAGEQILHEKNELLKSNENLHETIKKTRVEQEKIISNPKCVIKSEGDNNVYSPVPSRLSNLNDTKIHDFGSPQLQENLRNISPVFDYDNLGMNHVICDNPNFTLNKFSGDEDVFGWIDHSKQISQLNNWSDNDLYLRMKLSLTGKAYNIINLAEQKNKCSRNFESFIKLVLEKFQPKDPETHYTDKIV